MQRRIDWRVTKSGQPRPYADHFYEVELRFTNVTFANGKPRPDGPKPVDWTRIDNRESIIKLAALLTGWNLQLAGEAEWHEQRLTDCRKVGVGHWVVSAMQRYLD